MASTLRAITIIACLLSQIQHVQSKICYESNGFQSEKYFDCAPDAEVSACCGAGHICYSNGLCTPGPTVQKGVTDWYWFGCTDPTFQDPSCFSACFSVRGDGVDSCPNQGPNRWCCYGTGGCDCGNSSQVVTALAGSVVTTIDPGITSISSTKTTSTTSTTSVFTTTTPPSTTAGQETETGAAGGETAAPGETVGVTPNDTPPSEKSKNNAVPIGVGVGVGGAAAIAIAGLIFFFVRRRKQNAARIVAPEPKPGAATYGPPPQEMYSRGGNAAELSAAPQPIEYYQELPAGR
ncbi:hypothetical protein V493_02339 [Pseudogymnoascus sp. VKM F-4281 (FW-2241)]|nr:hypothetical protein V493_02339 [Pseudogymnoascus sp. VKM F-4281 (FW-2241)]